MLMAAMTRQLLNVTRTLARGVRLDYDGECPKAPLTSRPPLSWRVPREWRDSDTGSQGSAQLLDAKTISKMNSPQLRDLMGSRTMLEVISLRDWLVGDARRLDEPSKNLEELCSRLLAIGGASRSGRDIDLDFALGA